MAYTSNQPEGTSNPAMQSNGPLPQVRQFQQWKGTDYVPHNVHHSIRWNKQDPLDILNVVTDTPWQLVKNSKYGKNQRSTLTNKSNITGFVAASGSIPVGHTQKRKSDHDDTDKIPRKMMKMSEDILGDLDGPEGFIWDSENYSCAYDSLLTILLSIWSQDPVKWKGDFKDYESLNVNLRLVLLTRVSK
jgi:hypothetical protein